MRHLSISDLKGDDFRRWAEARKLVYRKVLRDPGASEYRKQRARQKLAVIEQASRR